MAGCSWTVVVAMCCVAVALAAPTSSTVRLQSGDGRQYGILEVFVDGTWGTVCQDGFTDTNAEVVCKSLGFLTGQAVLDPDYHPKPDETVPILFSGVSCDGTETNIEDCPRDSSIPDDCTQTNHSRDVGIDCRKSVLKGRLQGGDEYSGRMELLLDDKWGTICSTGFTDTDALVACGGNLGFGAGKVAAPGSFPPADNSAPILLANVNCDGTEAGLGMCVHDDWEVVGACTHANDVGVECGDALPTRLVDGKNTNATVGRLEVQINGDWGGVCSGATAHSYATFTDESAAAACHGIGFYSGRVTQKLVNNPYGKSENTFLSNVNCAGDEPNIGFCKQDIFNTTGQNCRKYIAIDCSPFIGDIRIVDGSIPTAGRLELFVEGQWGAVCNGSFTDVEASIACNMLNYPAGHVMPSDGTAALFWTNNVNCTGDEDTLNDCSHDKFSSSTECESSSYVTISCDMDAFGTRIGGSDGMILGYGRLEVFENGDWGTVCNDPKKGAAFDDIAATVACHSMGFHSGVVLYNLPSINEGDIWMKDVKCTGKEHNLGECAHTDITTADCEHENDVNIACITTRLVDGGPGFGRLEIFHEGEWGTVCQEGFEDSDAEVVCRSLGLAGVGVKVNDNYYGPGNTDDRVIWLNKVQCSGTEFDVSFCNHSRWNASDECSHDQDVGIDCNKAAFSSRLAGGNATSGRLEVKIDEKWGTVCRTGFTQAEALVACVGNLGFGTGSLAPVGTYPAGGHEPIWLSGVDCTNYSEYNDIGGIGMCKHDPWGLADAEDSCSNGDVVGLNCGASLPARLVNTVDNSPEYGRLELYWDGAYRTVCDVEFNPESAQVACRSLGFHSARIVDDRFGGETKPYFTGVMCDGTEGNIGLCPQHLFGKNDSQCHEYNSVSIDCRMVVEETRLVGGTPSAGRVEVKVNEVWGSVCDIGFNDRAARVACNSVGYLEGSIVPLTYGVGTGPIYLSNVTCRGNESDIGRCQHSGENIAADCTHDRDVAVSCKTQINTRVSEAGGSRGRLEVYYEGKWGTVCDAGFNQFDANVACKSLGFSGGSFTTFPHKYGPGIGEILLSNVACIGNESSIANCPSSEITTNCTHENDVGIECKTTRLVGGGADYGRVEVYSNGQWGTVCSNAFSLDDAFVVCNSLGFLSAAVAPYQNVTGTVLFDNVTCGGFEESLDQCAYTVPTTCSSIAAVDCRPYVETTRVSGGTYNSGRLEVFVDGTWGTVCSTGFNDAAATIACQNLGFMNGTVVADGSFPQGSGTIWLDKVSCAGTEDSIGSCSHSDYNSNSCTHAQDVGVFCNTAVATRLAGGGPGHGRVEVFNGGQWGTVCSDTFTEVEAKVVCSSLGYSVGEVVSSSIYGPGTGKIWLEGVHCRGSNENTLAECTHGIWGVTKCTHAQDAAVDCRPVRLQGGVESGIVELFSNRTWGTVCSAGFDNTAATVACKSLGYDYGSVISSINLTSDGSIPVYDQVKCSGSESSITECAHSAWGIVNCTSSDAVAIACKSSTIPTTTTTGNNGNLDGDNDKSHKGKTIALAVILPLVGVLAIAGSVMYIKRRNTTTSPKRDTEMTPRRKGDRFTSLNEA